MHGHWSHPELDADVCARAVPGIEQRLTHLVQTDSVRYLAATNTRRDHSGFLFMASSFWFTLCRLLFASFTVHCFRDASVWLRRCHTAVRSATNA